MGGDREEVAPVMEVPKRYFVTEPLEDDPGLAVVGETVGEPAVIYNGSTLTSPTEYAEHIAHLSVRHAKIWTEDELRADAQGRLALEAWRAGNDGAFARSARIWLDRSLRSDLLQIVDEDGGERAAELLEHGTVEERMAFTGSYVSPAL
jgi:hypothetical protein